ncbi:hypothetical protein [Brevibacterium yomogidense]|uniref:hypothetical protein n=1 Tax=Brevibacterium yomogidense TaxID=946573 RepID=UPI0018DFF46E|nr:hypothetical protein [Brevibacterium yomogidense]
MTGHGSIIRNGAGRRPRGRLAVAVGIAVIIALVVSATLLLQALRDDAVAVTATGWPGPSGVEVVDEQGQLGHDVSGLSVQTADDGSETLWAVRNAPGLVHRFAPDGEGWYPTDDTWGAGKQLRDTNGEGRPDAEALVFVENAGGDALYVAIERDNHIPDVSSLRVLRYSLFEGPIAAVDAEAPGGDPEGDGLRGEGDAAASSAGSAEELVATHDWDLSAEFPRTEPNEGFEGIAYVPDDALVSGRFLDESRGKRYDPDDYGSHGSGVFFVGMETTGMIYGYVLEDNGDFTRVSTIDSGLPALAELEYEPDTGRLWAICDDTCAGTSTSLELTSRWFWSRSRFSVAERYDRPAGMPDTNNEGFAISRDSSCADGVKPVYWSDDNALDGHVLRAGRVTCGSTR